ncbi:peptidylprolyl isomerase [Pseudidiomarina taiwanensis]
MGAIAVLSLLSFSTHAKVQPDNPFPKVKLVTTQGEIVVELNRLRAPLTVDNFLQYVQAGSYNGTIFHRIVPGFVVQGGGYDAQFSPRDDFGPIPNESGNGLKNVYGTIAMARENDPHSATRQFFFNMNDNESLDPGSRWGYTVFGWVVSGEAVLEEMASLSTAPFHQPTGWEDVPLEPPVLEKIEILPQP